jgi:hypothetical protein
MGVTDHTEHSHMQIPFEWPYFTDPERVKHLLESNN